jgi:hypothetical protein
MYDFKLRCKECDRIAYHCLGKGADTVSGFICDSCLKCIEKEFGDDDSCCYCAEH